MKLILRFITRELLAAISMSLAALLLLFALFDLIGQLDQVRSDGYTLGMATLFVLLQVPGRFQELLPIATLIGGVFGLVRLAMNSEFTIIRASGISTAVLVRHMVVLGALLGSLNVAVGEFVVPSTDRLSKEFKLRGSDSIIAQQFRSGLWAKDGSRFINIRHIGEDGHLGDIRMYEFDDHYRLQRIRQADTGHWNENGGWELEGVTDTQIRPEAIKLQHLQRDEWQSPITPDLLSALLVDPNHMALSALWSYVGYLKDNQQKSARYEIALWNKLSMPLAGVVMLLLALPFAYQQPRSGKLGNKILGGISIGLAFHLINRISGSLGLLNDWPAAFSAALPLVLFSILALLALRRVETA